MAVTFDDIKQAATCIRGEVENTPLAHSRTLSKVSGADVYLKLENLQFTASFKERGALNMLLSLSQQERSRGVIAMSAGNHAQAVAFHAQHLKIPTVIVMPRFTPNVKVRHTRSYGAEVVLYGDSLDEATSFALKTAEQRNLILVHPYDDVKVIAGQGTIALEMLAAQPELDVLFIPIGGGGLIAGNAVAAKTLNPNIEIIGVEAKRYPSMLSAIQNKKVEYGANTIADGIAVKQPGKLTVPLVKKYVDDIVLVDEEEIEAAVLLLLEVEKTVAEGSAAVGLAALMQNKKAFQDKKVGIIISGGNIDMPVLQSIIARGLVRSHRMTRIRVGLRDVPGTLASATQCIENSGANIVHVHHHRNFTELPLQVVEVEFILQTRGEEHVQEVIRKLQHNQFKVRSLY